VLVLLNWTLLVEWYMARLVLRTYKKKKTCVSMRLDYVRNSWTPFQVELLTQLGWPMQSLQEEESPHFDLL
jgi:hypothetical protein